MQKVALLVCVAALAGTASAKAEMMIVETPPPPKFPAPQLGPPPQVMALGKQLAGTWTCSSGETATIAIDVAGGWLRIATAESIELRTFDVVARQWTRVVMTAAGGYRTETSLGEQKGTWSWSGDGAPASERITADEYVRDDVTCRRAAAPAAAARKR